MKNWTAILAGLIFCASLLSRIVVYAQSDTEPVPPPIEIADLDLPPVTAPVRDDLGPPDTEFINRQWLANNRLEEFQRWVDKVLGPISAEHGSDAFDMDIPPTRFFARSPLNAVSGDRFSTNAYGANFSVPHGSFKGDGLVGLDEMWTLNKQGGIVPVNRSITRGRPGDRSFSGGWSFEPGGFLKETYETINVDHSFPDVTRCSVVLRYSYASRDSGSRFQ